MKPIIAILAMMIAVLFPLRAPAAETFQISVQGNSRKFLLERPREAGPRPTIVMLHGAHVEPVQEATESGLAVLGPREGFAVVFPAARGLRWNFFPPGDVPAREVAYFQPHGGVPDDVSFLQQLTRDLIARGIADPARIYLAGRSLGGVMTLRMACHDATPFAAIGLIVSTMADVTGSKCRIAKPLSLVMLSGTADPVLPYAGGLSRRGDMLWPAERVIQHFRDLNGCAAAARKSQLTGYSSRPIEAELSNSCRGGAVQFYRVVGGGHEPPANFGALLLDFFRDKSMTTQSVPRIPAHAKCRRFETRLFADFCGGCTRPPFRQELVRVTDDNWSVNYVDGNNVRHSYTYRAVSENSSEIQLHDATRNVHAKLDLVAKKGFVRRGSDWVPILDILAAHCE